MQRRDRVVLAALAAGPPGAAARAAASPTTPAAPCLPGVVEFLAPAGVLLGLGLLGLGALVVRRRRR
jgi:LPXTG-motif cell wall-anchored protein